MLGTISLFNQNRRNSVVVLRQGRANLLVRRLTGVLQIRSAKGRSGFNLVSQIPTLSQKARKDGARATGGLGRIADRDPVERIVGTGTTDCKLCGRAGGHSRSATGRLVRDDNHRIMYVAQAKSDGHGTAGTG